MLHEARLLVDTRGVVTVWAERPDLAIVAVQALTAAGPSLPAVDQVAPRGSPKNSQGALAALVRGAVLHMPDSQWASGRGQCQTLSGFSDVSAAQLLREGLAATRAGTRRGPTAAP
jgi:hypothetical protein